MTTDASQASKFVVIGAGLAGSATAWQLAASGHEVTVLERGVPADRAGSSHGSARIIRYTYPDPFYASLVVRSRGLWSQLEEISGAQLISPVGALDFGESHDTSTLAAVLDELRVDHEFLSPSQAAERWPGLVLDGPALWHPDGGVIDAESGVHAMLDQAIGHGARVRTGWEVAAVAARSGGGYTLTSTRGTTLDAARVVVAAGGWLPDLLRHLPLPAGFSARMPPLTVRQEQAFHFPYRDAASWPTFIHKFPGSETYSLPGGRDAGFRGQKLAEFGAGKVIGSAAEQDGVVDPANRSRLIDYVRTYLPGLIPETYAETTCLFTSTPTSDFLIDRYDDLILVSPCSGHGAKFAPVVGALAAEAASAESCDSVRALLPPRFLLRS